MKNRPYKLLIAASILTTFATLIGFSAQAQVVGNHRMIIPKWELGESRLVVRDDVNSSLKPGETIQLGLGETNMKLWEIACNENGLPWNFYQQDEIINGRHCIFQNIRTFIRFNGDPSAFSEIESKNFEGLGSWYTQKQLITLPPGADRLEAYMIVKVGAGTNCYVAHNSNGPEVFCRGPVVDTKEVYISNFGRNFLIPIRE